MQLSSSASHYFPERTTLLELPSPTSHYSPERTFPCDSLLLLPSLEYRAHTSFRSCLLTSRLSDCPPTHASLRSTVLLLNAAHSPPSSSSSVHCSSYCLHVHLIFRLAQQRTNCSRPQFLVPRIFLPGSAIRRALRTFDFSPYL